MERWCECGCGEVVGVGVGVMWEGCGNVGSVQEVSTHTLICYIDHPSTVHSIGQI